MQNPSICTPAILNRSISVDRKSGSVNAEVDLPTVGWARVYCRGDWLTLHWLLKSILLEHATRETTRQVRSFVRSSWFLPGIGNVGRQECAHVCSNSAHMAAQAHTVHTLHQAPILYFNMGKCPWRQSKRNTSCKHSETSYTSTLIWPHYE